MTNYTKTTDFAAKDALPSGNAAKIVKGSEIDAEFNNIATSSATKANKNNSALTGTTTFETISDGTIAITAFVDEDNMVSNSATLLPTQQSVKAYVDSQVTAQDLDFQADTGGALSIDLDSETITFTGGTGIDTSGALNAVTFAIDSTVATLTGTQTLSNKTLATPVVSGNLTTDGLIDGRDVATDGTKLDGIEASADVTDTANVTAAGALMDSELTSEASVKALNQGVATTDSPTFAGVTAPITGNVTGDLTGSVLTAAQTNITSVGTLGSLTVSGDVTVDTNSLKVDSTNNRVGVGTASPSKNVHISSGVNDTPTTLRLENTDTSINTAQEVNTIDFYSNDASTFGTGVSGKISQVAENQGTNYGLAFSTYSFTLSEAMRIDASGKVGIGTSSPASKLHVNTGSAGYGLTLAASSQTSGTYQLGIDSASNLAIYDTAAASQRLVISNAGNVGIGTSSPASNLEISDSTQSTGATLSITNSHDGLWTSGDKIGSIDFRIDDGSATQKVRAKVHAEGRTTGTYPADSDLVFSTADNNTLSEAMRIDSAGNALFGTTNTAPYATSTTGGMVFRNDFDLLGLSRGSNYALSVNRYGTDGDLVNFRKNGTTAGSIGVALSDNLYFSGVDAGIGCGTGSIYPASTLGQPSDNDTDLGTSGTRFKDLRLSGTAYVATSVGIGTTSPARKLTIQGGSGDTLPVRVIGGSGTTTGGIEFQDASTTADYKVQIGSIGDALYLRAGGAERMRIDSSGHAIFGKTSANNTAAGTTIYNEQGISVVRASNTTAIFNRLTSDGDIVHFRKNNSTVGSISVTGSATSYNTSSDQRLKENIADADDAGSKVDAIQVRKFDWIADGTHQDYGMIAQELQSVAPEAVTQPEDPEEMMAVDYSKLVPMLVKEIQSLRARVANLENN